MPRIDPYTLIKTLGLLLSRNGGIRSSEEVTRIVQLMHKFSKKMVSKCMYIQILKATTLSLLEKFLDEKGWDLLNAWLSESVASENWAQCKELIKLFSVCPVTATAIEDNMALKLVKKLTNDVGVNEQVKELALKVLKKWMSILNPSGDPKFVLSSRQDHLERNGGIQKTDKVEGLKNDVDCVDETSRTKESFSVSAEERKNNDDSKEDKRSFKRETEKEEVDKNKTRKHGAEKRRDKKEKDRAEKKSKPYSQTELRNDLGEMERSRIKIKAQKMKDDLASKKESSKEKSNAKKSTTSGLDELKNVSKKEIKEKGTSSFTGMLGALDSSKVKKTVKVAGSKNKNKGLLESLSSTNISKPPSSKHKQVKSTSSKPILPNSSREEVTTSSATKTKHDKTEENFSLPIDVPEKKSEKRPIEMDHPIVTNKAVLKECDIFGNVLSRAMHDDLVLNDYPRKKKLRLSDVKSGKTSSDTPKTEPKIEKKKDTFSFYGAGEADGNESRMENGTGNILNTAEGDQASEFNEELTKTHAPIVNEVSGILVIARGSKTTRNVNWKPDKDLVQIEYFDLDETERINVNKVKFDTMRQRETAMEKERFKTIMNKGVIEDEEDSTNSNNRIPWKLVELHSESALQEFGSGSQEKLTQAHREQTVLQAIIFNRKMPPVPSEPDFSVIPDNEPTLVPLEDTDENSKLFDYSLVGWYPSEDNRVPIAGPFSHSNGFNSVARPETSPSSLENHYKPNIPLNNALLAIQSFGPERLSPPVTALNQESRLEGPTNDKGYPIEPNVPPLQENNVGPLNFYGNGMEGNEAGIGPQPFYSGFPESGYDPSGSHGGKNGFPDDGYDPSGSHGGKNGFPNDGYDPSGSHAGKNGFPNDGYDPSGRHAGKNGFPENGYDPSGSHGGNKGFHGNGYDPTESHGGSIGFHEEMDQSRSGNTWNKEQGRGFGRGFSYRNGSNNRGYNGRGGGGGFRNNQNKLNDRNGGGRGGKQFIRGQKRESRPCKFWVEKGRCAHEERCRFKHPSQ